MDVDDRFIARWRLAAQGLVASSAVDQHAAVRGLLAVQAENYTQSSWAVAARTRATSTADAFDSSFGAGALLRTHVLRTTWHFVVPDDLVWLLELTGPALRQLYRQNQRGLGVDDETLDRAVGAVVDAIATGGPQTRADLRRHLRHRDLPADGAALTLVTATAEAGALVCSGPLEGTEHTHALVADRAPGARRLDRDEALAELALRYVVGHGPATGRDLAYWATLTLTDARRGLDAVADRLARFEHDGRTYWYGQEPPSSTEGGAHLLQILDEMYRGYQDSRWVLDADGLVPRQREATAGMALVDGQLVAAVKRIRAGSTLTFALQPYRPLTSDEQTAIEDVAARCAAFHARTPRVIW